MSKAMALTGEGPVAGAVSGGLCRWHGIPYCAPPLGERRFMPPGPALRRTGVLDCTGPAPVQPQPPTRLAPVTGEEPRVQSEDSLRLTVVAPEGARGLPVLVWLHGGANVSGGGDLDWYDGGKLARQGIVVVSVTYRLGAFGFAVRPECGGKTPAMEDVRMALVWVRDNVRAFGGDPGRVTLAGQSAGANAALFQLLDPRTRGLFGRLVLQSPSIGRACHGDAEARAIAGDFFSRLGAAPREASAGEVLRCARETARALSPRVGSMVWKPTEERLQDAGSIVSAAAEEGAARGIALLCGTARDEMRAFAHLSGASGGELREIQLSRFDRPALELCRALSEAGCEVFRYRFDWAPEDSPLGACHCIELPFLFGTEGAWAGAPMLRGAGAAELARLSAELLSHWGRFARGESMEKGGWSAFSSPGFFTMRFR